MEKLADMNLLIVWCKGSSHVMPNALSHRPDPPSVPSVTPSSTTAQPASVGCALLCRELYCPKYKRAHADHGRFTTFNHSYHRCNHCGTEFQSPVSCVGVVADVPPGTDLPCCRQANNNLGGTLRNVSRCSFDPRDPEMRRFIALAQSP